MLKRNLLVLAIVMVFLAGCFGAKFSRDSYRALAVSAATYQVAQGTARDLYAQGQITESQKAELNSKARIWRTGYHAAIDSLELYDKGFQTVEDVSAALLKVSSVLLEIQQLVEKGDL